MPCSADLRRPTSHGRDNRRSERLRSARALQLPTGNALCRATLEGELLARLEQRL